MEFKKSHSPLPKAKTVKAIQTIDFPEAMRAVIQGDRITKAEWADRDIYGYLHEGFLLLHKADGSIHKWIISDGDMFGQDWIIMKVN